MSSGYPIRVCGVGTGSSEALYQALRFPHLPEFQAEVLDQAAPILAKRHAYARVGETRPDWDRVRVNVMRYVLRAKFGSAQGGLLDLLRGTGEAPIVEVSHRDDYWGARPVNGRLVGRNVLGRLLMELRAELQTHPSGAPLLIEPRFPDPVLLGHPLTPDHVGPALSESPIPE
jgi:ribA/ribD-fused uncharacterized protein